MAHLYLLLDLRLTKKGGERGREEGRGFVRRRGLPPTRAKEQLMTADE
jgi:hypothetical protein